MRKIILPPILVIAFGIHQVNAQSAATLDSLINVYQSKKDTASLVKTFIRRADTYGLDTTFWGKLGTNNLIYTYFLASNDRRVLEKGALYMKQVTAYPPADSVQHKVYGVELDTYAHLLEKLGEKKMALTIQRKAITFYPGDKDIRLFYEQLLKRQ